MVMYKPVVCPIGGADCPVARLEDELEVTQDKIAEALSLLWCYGQYEGDTQRQVWLLDQVVRELTGDQYDDWVRKRTGNDGSFPNKLPWSTGTSP
jgi:hypothetical protein